MVRGKGDEVQALLIWGIGRMLGPRKSSKALHPGCAQLSRVARECSGPETVVIP